MERELKFGNNLIPVENKKENGKPHSLFLLFFKFFFLTKQEFLFLEKRSGSFQ
jgi:hypothetical protein